MSIKSSNSICIACIADLEFAHKQYPNTFLGGTSAGQDCIRLLRQHVDELGEDLAGPAARILVAWVPPAVRLLLVLSISTALYDPCWLTFCPFPSRRIFYHTDLLT